MYLLYVLCFYLTLLYAFELHFISYNDVNLKIVYIFAIDIDI